MAVYRAATSNSVYFALYNLNADCSDSRNIQCRPSFVATRFHAGNHTQADCLLYCNPEIRSDPILWSVDSNGEARFRWNSAIQESLNSVFHKLGPTVKKMSATMNSFILLQNMLVSNELALKDRLLRRNARFRP